MAEIVWFITGTSSGFGKAIALEALRRGHKVIATARDSSKLSDLKAAGAAVLDIDVTGDEETLATKLKEASAIYGKITHVVNCAGYILEGAVEEASAKEVLDTFTTNVFGTINIARAVTPYLRSAAANSEVVALANFGSLGSWNSGPAVAHYCSTKWAVSGLTEGLADELRPFGIRVCIIEPGYTRTEFLSREEGKQRRVLSKRRLEVYNSTAALEVRNAMEAYNGNQPGDVDKSAVAIVDVLTMSGMAKGRQVPMRLVLGSDALDVVRTKCRDTLKLMDEWEEISKSNSIEM